VRPACRYGVIRHGYTNHRIVMHCFGLRLAGAAGEGTAEDGGCPPAPASFAPDRERRWVTPEEPAAMPLPAPHRKLAERIT
jgi:A/G-specific adenine glycosylase